MAESIDPVRVEAASANAAELLEKRLARLRDEPPYRHYLRARSEVLRMKTAEAAADDRPSGYWHEELGNIEYLLDASPLIVEKLRHHTLHVTGIKAYEYRSQADERAALVAEKLLALDELGEERLRVAESPDLGGFGFELHGGLYNIDTLKFYEALVAMERGEVLGQFRDGTRRVVVEIGPGWGGFAYQFRTLFPNTSYVLVDLPELFLLSAVYLATHFPHAKIAFWDDDRPLDPSEIAEYDFVFAPYTAFPTMQFEEISLAINMVSFQEMTTAQVEGYVHRLYDLGCRFLYSLNRDRSGYNTELTGVREIMASRYWLNEIPVLPVPYTRLVTREEMEERRRREQKKGPDDSPRRYRHVIGWRRVSPDAPDVPASA